MIFLSSKAFEGGNNHVKEYPCRLIYGPFLTEIYGHMTRLNSGIKNRNNFFVRAFFYFQKTGTDSVYQADSRDIKILVRFPGKSILKFLFGF